MAAAPDAQATPKPTPGNRGSAAGEKKGHGREAPEGPSGTRANAHHLRHREPPAAPAADRKPQGRTPKIEPPKIETGSISPAGHRLRGARGHPARQLYAVQLATGPSLDALRLSWGLLVERHGAHARRCSRATWHRPPRVGPIACWPDP